MEDTARKFRAAAVQISPVLFDRDATSEKVVEYVDRCGREG
ncbi:MAG: aliphatic nitrilase, partial [Deltaproteobacteria bacterium]